MAVAFPETHPIAVDIEKIDQDNVYVIKNQLTAFEQELISQDKLPENIAFTAFWTIKESLSKY